ncbi:hypothetical protein QAD02_014201 [Eretmocerus hayati]|uniref:Uncharacterized protein n=1 Tax=Eretmocerus hayati TaxID=131215 RepID=A0ACC2P490_9HYME|nr:hypothetical protein QAD02_014201 [Eretmocerus hayati]
MEEIEQQVEEVKSLRLRHHRAIIGQATPEEISEWISDSLECIHRMKTTLTPSLKRSSEQRLQAAIGYLESIRRKLEIYIEYGYGLTSTSKYVIWDDVESAFSHCIRSGVITNLKHTNTDLFFDDARALFITEIFESLQEHNALKVNTVLTAEYKIVKNDEESIDLKHFNTEKKQSKIALSARDDNRYLRHGETDPLSWGHHNISTDGPVPCDLDDGSIGIISRNADPTVGRVENMLPIEAEDPDPTVGKMENILPMDANDSTVVDIVSQFMTTVDPEEDELLNIALDTVEIEWEPPLKKLSREQTRTPGEHQQSLHHRVAQLKTLGFPELQIHPESKFLGRESDHQVYKMDLGLINRAATVVTKKLKDLEDGMYQVTSLSEVPTCFGNQIVLS